MHFSTHYTLDFILFKHFFLILTQMGSVVEISPEYSKAIVWRWSINLTLRDLLYLGSSLPRDNRFFFFLLSVIYSCKTVFLWQVTWRENERKTKTPRGKAKSCPGKGSSTTKEKGVFCYQEVQRHLICERFCENT